MSKAGNSFDGGKTLRLPGALTLLAIAFGIYLAMYMPLFAGLLGLDYSLHFPNLLAGYYWFRKNGLFAVPWFNPAQCGGVPFLADPNVVFYSVPQWATFIVSPVAALRWTFATFAAIGATGFFALMRQFAVSPWAALTAAVLFLFNGFYVDRMTVGHLTFHPFMLTPWLACALLVQPPAGAAGFWINKLLFRTAIAALILAYMFQAGMVLLIPGVVLLVVIILLVHGQLKGHQWWPWIALIASIILSLLISAQRLSAELALVAQFPRNLYPIPGFEHLFDIVGIFIHALFWDPATVARDTDVVNFGFAATHFDQHEWDFDLGPMAGILALGGIVLLPRRAWSQPRRPSSSPARLFGWAIIAGILVFPVFLNWYQPTWNSFLKSLPYFNSTMQQNRWIALYIPVVALFCGLVIDRLALGNSRLGAGLFVTVTAATVGWNLIVDRPFLTSITASHGYNTTPVERAWSKVEGGAEIPAITDIFVFRDQAQRPIDPLTIINRNDPLVAGYSSLNCYQPMFGYQAENYVVGPLQEGPTSSVLNGGFLNTKNPACYVFPKENACRPGDHFNVFQRSSAARFLNYEPFDFAAPSRQRVADMVNLVALGVVVLMLAFGALPLARRGP